MPTSITYQTIGEYINQYPLEIRIKLNELKAMIKESALEATEKISWGMPTFYLYGNLVQFAAHKKHIGFYPGADCVELFSNDIGDLKHSKGAIQFPFDKEIPRELVKKIVLYRTDENLKINQIKNSKR